MGEFEKRLEELLKDTKGFKETVALKAQREDITIINNSLVNYATKADLDNV